MLRLPEGVTIERSESKGEFRIRCRVLTEATQAQSTDVIKYFSFDSARDRMELDVLEKLCAELDRLRLAIASCIEKGT